MEEYKGLYTRIPFWKIYKCLIKPLCPITANGKRTKLRNNDGFIVFSQQLVVFGKNFIKCPPLAPGGNCSVIKCAHSNPVYIIFTRVVLIEHFVGGMRRPYPYYIICSNCPKAIYNVLPGCNKIFRHIVLRPPRVTIGVVHFVSETQKNQFIKQLCLSCPSVY